MQPPLYSAALVCDYSISTFGHLMADSYFYQIIESVGCWVNRFDSAGGTISLKRLRNSLFTIGSWRSIYVLTGIDVCCSGLHRRGEASGRHLHRRRFQFGRHFTRRLRAVFLLRSDGRVQQQHPLRQPAAAADRLLPADHHPHGNTSPTDHGLVHNGIHLISYRQQALPAFYHQQRWRSGKLVCILCKFLFNFCDVLFKRMKLNIWLRIFQNFFYFAGLSSWL